MPNPTEREKKPCPRAAAHTSGVILEKSGRNRYFSPSPAPGRVTDLTAMAITVRKSTGIIIFPNFSIPLFTPPRMTRAVSSMKAVCQSRGAQVEEMNPLNIVPSSSLVAPCEKENVQALNRYSRDQPPMTL